MSPDKKIKILIVDDSLLFRKTLENHLIMDSHFDVVGTAIDSKDAMDKIIKLKPDVLTLDVEMPKVNGIDFLKQLMPTHPMPVVVVSSQPANALNALDAGAVDFVRKPDEAKGVDFNSFINELIVKIKIASTARTGRKLIKKPLAPSNQLTATNSHTVISIGASTGGTEAILSVIKDLPVTTPGIVIVQHMPPVFTNMYAERLNKLCKMHVKEAEDGDRVQTGSVLVAAGGKHMTLHKDTKGYYIHSREGEKVSSHCPSVDVLFNSVAKCAGKHSIGIILTGMGGDGSKGLLSIKKSGGYTLGQDRETCVVYGMPMVANNIGAVTKQLPLNQISSEIINYLNSKA
ncbi:MAG: chemotaxis response regulator protein-glutamate methylesterase [Angelakisella sp.]|nr:chemotaxis response regulator protein-glutamate methylesterase [Angelakisella sp.]